LENTNTISSSVGAVAGGTGTGVGGGSSEEVEEIARLKAVVSRQEDLIGTLNGKYSSMLRLLEDRSTSAHGSTVLADYHRLENEVATLRKEKVD